MHVICVAACVHAAAACTSCSHPCSHTVKNFISQGNHAIACAQACFDDTRGGLALSHCACEAARAELEGPSLKSSHYLALGAAGALLHFLEQVLHDSLFVHVCNLYRHREGCSAACPCMQESCLWPTQVLPHGVLLQLADVRQTRHLL